MVLAQRLYEAGHITYMRTDSTNLSNEAVESCREFIGGNFGDRYLPEEAVRYSSKEGAQEAATAVEARPVGATLPTTPSRRSIGLKLSSFKALIYFPVALLPSPFIAKI